MQILTVSQLNRQIRNWLEHEVGEICVEGEISNLSKPTSGHFYFTMKDASAQVRCVFFRNRHLSVHVNLQNGQQVVARGQLSLYEARGDYQLIIEELSEAGQGDLYLQFELLKAKLAALGLFEAARKKALPRFPNGIGVVTSASGAALRDILTTLGRRFPLARVFIYPSDVQGKLAAGQLTLAIQRANQDKHCDVLIIARGGGSIEDLWAFNDENLAHAIAASVVPIVSGVGHETDFTIADFVADLRAATPTAAAEAVTPDCLELIAYFQSVLGRLMMAMHRYMQHKMLLLQHQLQKITSPGQLIFTYWQKLDHLEHRLQRALGQSLLAKQHRLQMANTHLQAQNPSLLITQARSKLTRLEEQLRSIMLSYFTAQKQRLHAQLITLHAVSPLATLERGYAIVMHGDRLIIEDSQVSPGDRVNIRLAKGQLTCEVIEHEQ